MQRRQVRQHQWVDIYANTTKKRSKILRSDQFKWYDLSLGCLLFPLTKWLHYPSNRVERNPNDCIFVSSYNNNKANEILTTDRKMYRTHRYFWWNQNDTRLACRTISIPNQMRRYITCLYETGILWLLTLQRVSQSIQQCHLHSFFRQHQPQKWWYLFRCLYLPYLL